MMKERLRLYQTIDRLKKICMQLKQHICASKVMLSNLNHCFSVSPPSREKVRGWKRKKGTSVECQESNEPIISTMQYSHASSTYYIFQNVLYVKTALEYVIVIILC